MQAKKQLMEWSKWRWFCAV